jgi:hypothetical protein
MPDVADLDLSCDGDQLGMPDIILTMSIICLLSHVPPSTRTQVLIG